MGKECVFQIVAGGTNQVFKIVKQYRRLTGLSQTSASWDVSVHLGELSQEGRVIFTPPHGWHVRRK